MRRWVKLELLLAAAWLLPAAIETRWAADAVAQEGTQLMRAPAARAEAGAYPEAANTGVPADMNFIPATRFSLDVAGETLSGLDFQGPVTIAAPNVTLRNCRITANGWAALDIRADGVTVENCEINGQSTAGIRGISVSGGNVSIRRCNIHHVEDGIYLTETSNLSIENNYIHDLQSDWGEPHFDGIATDGGVSDVLIRGNTVINPHGQTSAVMLSNYFGPISGVLIEGNRLIGGGYTVYADGQFTNSKISGVTFLGNRLGRGFYGYASIQKNSPKWSGNIDDKLGTPVSP